MSKVFMFIGLIFPVLPCQVSGAEDEGLKQLTTNGLGRKP
jgi:hypothetical protein